MFCWNIEAYIQGCDICLALKAVMYKPYNNLQSLPILTHYWKNLSINFIIGILISPDWKGDSYDMIFVIINRLTKIVYHESIKTTIDKTSLVEIIIDVIVRYCGLFKLIISDQGLLFTSKFLSLLCYFFNIK